MEYTFLLLLIKLFLTYLAQKYSRLRVLVKILKFFSLFNDISSLLDNVGLINIVSALFFFIIINKRTKKL
jgi:hypothetical protein